MNPILFNLFGIEIRWYSVMILCGILLGFFLASREAKKYDMPKDFIFDVGFWCVVFGIIGARLYYVLFNLNYYMKDPLEIFRVWNGGLAIHGGILFGTLALCVYCKYKKVKILEVTDIAVVSLIIAQSIGRWGNFFNSEAYGSATTLQNLQNMHIPTFIINGMKINGVYYHPTFFYESLWCLGGFCALIFVRKFFKSLKVGQLTCFYMMWYGIGRFFIEALRTDSLMFGSFKIAQIVSISFCAIGFIMFLYFGIKGKTLEEKVNKPRKLKVK